MEILIIIMFVAAMWHFIYEGIILPELRIEIRYKIFAVRDKLREIKITKSDQITDELFAYLDDAISNTITHLPYMNLRIAYLINKRIKENEVLRNEIQHKTDLILASKISEIKDIDDLMTKYTTVSMLCNSGGWALYLFPISVLFLLTLIILDLIKQYKIRVRRVIHRISLVPEYEVSRIAIRSETSRFVY